MYKTSSNVSTKLHNCNIQEPLEKEDMDSSEIHFNRNKKIIGTDKRYHPKDYNDILWTKQNVLSKEYLKKSNHPDISGPHHDCYACGGIGCSYCS